MSHPSTLPRPKRLRALCLLLCTGLSLLPALLAPAPARAAKADLPLSPDKLQATIPGTSMTRDEFRARAYAQLGAVALNAHAYYAVNGRFPAEYYDLFNSDAWNLDVTNIFNHKPINAIEFKPQGTDFTSAPPVLFPLPGGYTKEDTDLSNQQPIQMKDMSPDEIAKGMDALTQDLDAASTGGARRVNPDKIPSKTAGDIYYFVQDKLLQLVMFAPDGTYMEYVAETPNQGWLSLLNIKSASRSFPADLYANQVLLYMERVLPRHYNLVRFMASTEPVAEADLQHRGPAERLDMARELGVTINNPYSKQPAKLAQGKPKAGDLVAGDAAKAALITIALRSGEVVSFDQLSAGVAPAGTTVQPGHPVQPKLPTPPKNPPPLGGRDAR